MKHDPNYIAGVEKAIKEKYGKDGIVGNGDFHPNSLGQRYFYETIIKKLLQPKLI